MRVGDLFSGIGGFSLAAEWMGWTTAFFSEIDPFASRVLAHHWPDVPNYGDITRIDWTTVEPVDVLTGGFPCQPHSLAGLRKGSADERDLFDEIIRAAGVLRPRYLVLENVPGLFTSDRGRFFGRVLGAVAALGYDAEWRVLSAADVGAPHRRERVWIVADRQGVDGGGANSQRHARPETGGADLQEAAHDWATPSVKGNHNYVGCSPTSGDGIATQAASWSTPRAEGGERGQASQFDGLMEEARDWATPTTRDHKDSGDLSGSMVRQDGTPRDDTVPRQAQSWTGPTPSPSAATTAPSAASPTTQRSMGLNPRFTQWLMGYPPAWLSCVASAMPSSRSARSKSSAASKRAK